MTHRSSRRRHTVQRFAASIARLNPREAATALGLSLLTALLEGSGAMLLVPLLAMIGLDVANGGVSRIAGVVRTVLGHLHVPVTLGPVLLLYVATVSAQAVLGRWQTLATARLEHGYVAHLRRVLCEAWVRSEWSWQGRWRGADVAHVIIQQVDRAGLGVYQLMSAVSMLVVSLVYLAIAFRVSPTMTVVVCGAAAVVLVLLRGDVARSEQEGQALTDRSRHLFATLSEHLAVTRLAKALGREDAQVNALTHACDALAEAHTGATRVYTGSRATVEIGAVVALAMLLYGSLTWLRLDAGGVAMLMYVFARLMPRAAALQQAAQHIAHRLPAYAAVDAFRAEADAAREPAVPEAVVDLTTAGGDIALEHVSYVHAGGTAPTLHDICATIPARGLSAVVGSSGAGKSTLADLLCGLLAPSDGRLRVRDIVIDGRTRTAWRRSVGYVEQDAVLLNDTVRVNLQWAAPHASEADMRLALARAAATFVFTLPNGLDTVVGDRGMLLSGGERQRLALARVLLTSPRMLVLDEPTSALDSAHEEQVLDTLEQLAHEMPVVLITHRLSAVRRAQHILVLDGGRLVEAGDWGTLRAQSAGRFRALCSAQGVAVP
ncbi:MAG: ABC transporter ATP-binding protein [Acidobacteria bacterium]|nr:ABC transporter ATP-binding protein [Acidobacteriota bacterium]